MKAPYIATLMGCVLILSGIVMVAYQMSKISWDRVPTRALQFGRGGIVLKTTYPGLILVGIGAVLVMTGAITSN